MIVVFVERNFNVIDVVDNFSPMEYIKLHPVLYDKSQKRLKIIEKRKCMEASC